MVLLFCHLVFPLVQVIIEYTHLPDEMGEFADPVLLEEGLVPIANVKSLTGSFFKMTSEPDRFTGEQMPNSSS